MYVPPLFKEDRIDVLHAAIRGSGLATLVTLTADGLIASHVPMLLDPDPAPYGTLLGHVARPNPQARGAVPGVQALAIFQGPDAYVTPSWYATKRDERQGRADVELRDDPCLRAGRVLRRHRAAARHRHAADRAAGGTRGPSPGR